MASKIVLSLRLYDFRFQLEWVKVMPDGKGKLIAVGSRLRTLEPRFQVIRVPGHKALSILVIRDVRHQDAGKYRCHLSLATMRHRYFQLDVLGKVLRQLDVVGKV